MRHHLLGDRPEVGDVPGRQGAAVDDRDRSDHAINLLPMCPQLITASSRAGRRHALGARRLLVAVLAVLLLAALWWTLPAGPEVPLADRTELPLVRVEHIPPWVYLISFVVFPAFGVPIFAYYLTIGVVIDGLGWTLLAAWTCTTSSGR
ncbi:hypothetical protein [Thiocapsa sp.]|uniref:hypothetical protein n=1 Tax=Thiocapsa sp. TaxID=2024551 RepID=UPI002C4DE772|nr:hypothetical protein [Thiocapsa sp.]HSO84703.1 hypothetical protein [Thiocapsa sp.]